MAGPVNQDPDDLSRIGNDNHGVAPASRERAKTNDEYRNKFYGAYGYAAHSYLVWSDGQYRTAHETGWNTKADGHDTTGDNAYVARTNFEGTDIHGGTQIRRTAPEV